MRSSRREDCQELLAHAGWVRSLARYLAADAHTGDDLAQEALAAALTSPPPGDRSLRSWLGAIVRNLVRRERRTAGNRVARERAVARDDAEASERELDLHLETHRAVVDAVARLAEPYRSAILMRYFEELSPAAIAARTGSPLRTVHTRLHRGLNALRADLDRAHGGDRKSWLLALIPYARGSSGWSTAAIGALVMDAKLKIALAALAVVGVCSTLALWSAGAKDGSTASPLAAAPSANDERVGDAPRTASLEGATERVERRAQPALADPPPVAPAKATEASRLSGRVIDVERAPVASVRVRCFDPARPADAVEATTDAHGAFELADPGERVRLDVASPGWTAVLRPDTQQVKSSRELVLVVARSVKLAGLVVDELGHPVESASVAVPLPFGMRARFDAILDASSTVEPSVRTGADGRFVLEAAPSVAGAKLVTSHAAYVNDEREVPARDELAFEIVLRSVRTAPERLVGKVVDPAGAPVEGAWVALGDASAKSGPGGAFALELSAARRTNTKEAEATILRAVKRGFLPGELVRAGGSDWPATIVLALGEPPLAIAGRVVDAKGAPVPGAEVWTDEETHFGYIDIEGGEMTMRAGANVEGILRGDPWTRRVRTDAGGYFELGGLLAHDYRVHALDKRHVSVTTVSAPAGVHNVEIRMPDEEHFARVAGRVTSLSGDPIEGLEVALERHVAGIQGTEVEGFASRATRTDADGRFTFGEIARAVDLVRVSGEQLGLTGFEHPITRDDDVEKLVIAVPVSVHVQVDGGESRDFDQVALLDARGEKLQISVYHGQSAYAMREITVQEGRTEPFTVSESAKTLVLYKQKVEVRRVSVELEPGKLNTLRP